MRVSALLQRPIRNLAVASLAVTSVCAPAAAQSVEDFYKGNTVEIVIGLSAGGGYDVYSRMVARHLAGHIPGRPTIVARNMTGGGSRVAANYGYNVARKDGTTLVVPDQSLPLQQALGDPTVKFDSNRLNWIGNPIADNNILSAWHTTGVTRWEQTREKVLSLGATGPNTSAWYGMAMNAMVGTKFKIIMGYPGGNEINLAMEKGEIDVRGSNSWSSWKVTRPQWIADKKLNVLVQIGLSRAPDLPDAPLLMELPTNPDDKAALRLLSAPTTIGRPIFAPPGVPAERIAALRAAFDATMKDPAFIAEAQRSKLDLQPVSGAELQKIVAEIVATTPKVVQRLKTALDIK